MRAAALLLVLTSCCPKGEHVTSDPKYCTGFLRVCAPDQDAGGEGEGE